MADTEYWFRFTATNGVDVADTSTPARVVSHLSAAQIPTISGIASNGTDITLAWVDRDENGTGFVVEYYAEGAGATGRQEVASTNWTHRTRTPNTRYFYRVGATNTQFGGSFSGYSTWTNQVTGGAAVSTGTTTVLTSPAFNTVDAHGDIPGDDDNNIDKFDTGGSHKAEFTTTLYVRSSSSADDRRVKAYVRFDLSPLAGGSVTGATLRFRGFSLNDNGGNHDTSLQVSRLIEDWTAAATPYTPATTDMVAGGSITTPGAPTTGADFAVDVTAIVGNWVEGAANHGFFLQTAHTDRNNGLGIKTEGGQGAIELVVRQAGTPVDPHDTDGDGILDAWEQQHWGSLTNANDTTASDADPCTDLQEYIADTDPTNPASYFRILDLDSVGDMRIRFDSSIGRLYSLQFTDNLPGSSWSNVPGHPPRSGFGTNDVMTATNPVPRRYYRLGVSVP